MEYEKNELVGGRTAVVTVRGLGYYQFQTDESLCAGNPSYAIACQIRDDESIADPGACVNEKGYCWNPNKGCHYGKGSHPNCQDGSRHHAVRELAHALAGVSLPRSLFRRPVWRTDIHLRIPLLKTTRARTI